LQKHDTMLIELCVFDKNACSQLVVFLNTRCLMVYTERAHTAQQNSDLRAPFHVFKPWCSELKSMEAQPRSG